MRITSISKYTGLKFFQEKLGMVNIYVVEFRKLIRKEEKRTYSSW